MSFRTRFVNVFRSNRLNKEIQEELQSHIEEGIRQGRDPAEARRAFGPVPRQFEASRDARLVSWLDALRADTLFGCRQLRRNKAASAAAILSLALAIGACTSAFRLIDALLLRPLPIASPERLYSLSRLGIGPEGKPQSFDGGEYPLFRRMRAAVKDRAEMIAISYSERMDMTYRSDQEMEKANLQYVSGWMFASFGLRPVQGRLFTENDDLIPGAHPYAVLSQDYWARRFGHDPKVVGRTFRMGTNLFEIVGVAGESFTGTEPGTVTDIFVPTMMHPFVGRSDATWFRPLAYLKPGVEPEPVRQRLQPILRAFQAERAKGFVGMPKQRLENFVNQKLVLEPAAGGVSGLQGDYRRSLMALGVLVALVLLIACANVANLMTAQAAARSREMALRVSIGAGRWRLIRMVLVESALLAFLAAGIGAAFAWWSAPFVVGRINPPDNPARLALPADASVFGFALALTLGVTLLFGLAPALRASAVSPASALKGGDDPHVRHRPMHVPIAAQIAFCFLVVFVAGLFTATFERLSNQPTGFSAERLLTLDTVAERAQDPSFWEEIADKLRTVKGVEAVALADWALMNGNSRNNFISIGGAPPSDVLTYFRYVGPGWTGVMRIPLIAGRDFRPGDAASSGLGPGAAIVNETFVKDYFNGENPVGRSFERGSASTHTNYRIVGVTRDARYRSLREPMLPVAYVPFRSINAWGALQPVREGTFIVRTSGTDPLQMANALRAQVARAGPGFRVTSLHTQLELNLRHTVRERLLAMLALFFAAVALLLAGVGLYGVLGYSVLQRRREIAIRIAIGAQAAAVARLVTLDVFRMVLVGALAGGVLGLVCARYIESLFYEVKATDLVTLAIPAGGIIMAALLASVPPVFRALRTDPAKILRAD